MQKTIIAQPAEKFFLNKNDTKTERSFFIAINSKKPLQEKCFVYNYILYLKTGGMPEWAKGGGL